MFEYLNGLITAITPSYIVVDVKGVGYKVQVANPYRYEENQEARVYVEQIVRDNEQSLYGFYDLNEKNIFLHLISVSGIGPKSALAILAGQDLQGLIHAIENDDVKFLTKFPKIGKKTAQQIILDLSGKFTAEGQMTLGEAPVEFSSGLSQELEDGLAALESLGYSSKEISKVKSTLEKEHLKSADEYLRAGLKLLSK
ncbi:Holliday junction DNA helicase RuvA [Companilactobacillus paralimentarius DSM 13238 = JCM 10415]|jgi:Holliday junction DNA helicase, RuvA subunit|uniref:Holliday junction branch migration complex subunit RuvA n=1 Tax=Companilactobacillus paralimentarius DSM 13238 = JCM 10415 TaxID=1122151 RepID=A0A0R1PNH7_9LACO|nr:Holliday junction branch migration protein RuvA [Companilactobacillus paralimentarius]KAE9563064.1 Holliday junction ATP-dependent DNA helicase RuvA [Companilactobacillus paralimentarius]KRL31876.1 Holliday junction DNA helicase RuvA [Companilactobacillus paralimentarius DSM 13238 = JCM 10415]MDR4933403.1 Holliday junction branch migration protein RuvA [Companilactobacillus paralimentarius]QFR69892.1 Holliday junction branch migration protein RuvA [Companilactobacillus paralimentarius]